MKEFTKDEKTIARNINKEYKWIARDSNGALYAYKRKPKKAETAYLNGGGFNHLAIFDHLFSAIKWGDEPTLISYIYNPQILNDTEREYLKAVLKPFYDEVEYVVKCGHIFNDDGTCGNEYLYIEFRDGNFTFPGFCAGKMYTGMELDLPYKLDELGITYEE